MPDGLSTPAEGPVDEALRPLRGRRLRFEEWLLLVRLALTGISFAIAIGIEFPQPPPDVVDQWKCASAEQIGHGENQASAWF